MLRFQDIGHMCPMQQIPAHRMAPVHVIPFLPKGIGLVEQMMDTKKQFGKTDKRQGYHIILSFKEDEVEPDRAFEITPVSYTHLDVYKRQQ